MILIYKNKMSAAVGGRKKTKKKENKKKKKTIFTAPLEAVSVVVSSPWYLGVPYRERGRQKRVSGVKGHERRC